MRLAGVRRRLDCWDVVTGISVCVRDCVMKSVSRLWGTSGWFLPICLFAFLLPSGALAQSSVGQAANAATAQSLREAVEGQQKEMLGSAGGGGVGAAIGIGAVPSGRLRFSDHEALKNDAPPSPTNLRLDWETREASAFGTFIYTVPGSVLGGQMKLTGVVGHNWLSLKMKSNSQFQLDATQSGKANNESFLFGGSALWSQKNTYLMGTVIGFMGETELKDSIDGCPCPPAHRYTFDTSGFVGSFTAGNVFPLSKSPTGPMLDIRGVASYTQNIGDSFFNDAPNGGDQQKYKFSMWTLTGSATLFSNITMANSALLRPYVQTYVRQEVGYSSKLHFIEAGGAPAGLVHYEQAHTYGGVDVGATYTQGKMTLGAAAYVDGSADELTFGGRLGASWKLN
jgi:hypothetical protein